MSKVNLVLLTKSSVIWFTFDPQGSSSNQISCDNSIDPDTFPLSLIFWRNRSPCASHRSPRFPGIDQNGRIYGERSCSFWLQELEYLRASLPEDPSSGLPSFFPRFLHYRNIQRPGSRFNCSHMWNTGMVFN